MTGRTAGLRRRDFAIGWQGTAIAAAVPVNTVAPVVSGTPTAGQVLSVTNGTWTTTITLYEYEWYRGVTQIAGALSNTYTLVSADVGQNIFAIVYVTNAALLEAAASSNVVGPVAAAGGEALLAGETNALGVDFAYATDAQRVAVKTAGAVVSSALDSFFQNQGTSPKHCLDATGVLVWSPHNLFLNSAVPATQSVTTAVGQAYTVTVTGSGSLTGSAGAAGVATAGSPLTYVATTTTSTFTLAGSLTAIQMNNGRVATAYLATTAAKRYGLAIDYDPTFGATWLMEGGATNLCIWASDLTQTAWVKTNATAAFTATGPTGFANTATTLTATAANATALQSITNASSSKITSVFIKRRTGTGNVDLTQDNGTTWATVSVTSSWARHAVAEATVLNPTIGIRLVASGDAVDVAFWQCENSAVARIATSPIPTYAATATRAADNYTFLLSTIPALGLEYSVYVRFASPGSPASNANAPIALTDGTTQEQAKFAITASALRLSVIDGGTTLANIVGSTVTANTLMSAAGRFKLNDCAMSTNGAAVATDTAVTLPTVTETRYGGAGTNAAAANSMRLTRMVIVTDRGWNDATLVTKSAT